MNDSRVVQRPTRIRNPRTSHPPPSHVDQQTVCYSCHNDNEECEEMCGVSELSIRRFHNWRDSSRPTSIHSPTKVNMRSGGTTILKREPPSSRHSYQRDYGRPYEEPYLSHRPKFIIEEYAQDVYNDDEEVYNFYLQNIKGDNDWEDNSLTGLINEYRQNPDSVSYLSRILNNTLKIQKMEQEMDSIKKELSSLRAVLSNNMPTEAAAFSLSNLSTTSYFTPPMFDFKSVNLLKVAEKVIVSRSACNIHQKTREFLRRTFSELVDNDKERLMLLTVRQHCNGSNNSLIPLPEEIIDCIIDFLSELNGWKRGTIKSPEQLVCDSSNLRACTDVLNGLRYVRKRARRPTNHVEVEVEEDEHISV